MPENLAWELDGRLPVWACDGSQPGSRDRRASAAVRSVLDEYGLVLLRGFDLSAEQVLRWVSDLCGGWGYTKLAPSGCDENPYRVFTSEFDWNMHERHQLKKFGEKRGGTTKSRGIRIGLHTEQSHEPFIPAWIWFFVAKAADHGGETVLCDGESVVSGLSDTAFSVLADDIMYLRRSSTAPQPTEPQVVSDPPGTDRRYRRQIVEQPDGFFETAALARPIIHSRVGGHRVFANRILASLLEEHDDDGGRLGEKIIRVRTRERKPLPDNLIRELRDVTSSLSFSLLLREKEILWLDNTRFLHGREAYTGPRYVTVHRRFHRSQLSSSPDFAWAR